MPYIKVNFQQLAQLESKLSQLSNEISSAAETASSVRNSLDWDVACEESIDRRLRRLSETLEGCVNRMRRTASFAEDAVIQYRENEEHCAKSEADLKVEGERLLKMAQEMKIQNAINNAISTDDPIANYLAGVREKNESFLIQAAAYGYNLASFKWVDFAKKMIPGSETVEEARKIAIQQAYASMLQTTEPKPVDTDTFDTAASLILGGAEQLVTNTTGKGDAGFAVAGFLKGTIIDKIHYDRWDNAQKKLLAETLNSSAENIRLLNELKTAFPEDTILVNYCDDTIREINLFLKSDDLTKMIDSYYYNKGVDSMELAIGKNAVESGLDFAIPKVVEIGINKALGAGGGVVTAVGGGVGYAAELLFGTGTTAESFENVDILYTNIEATIGAYEQTVNSGKISASAQRFMELNILKQKMAALDMTTSINQHFGMKDEDLVNDIESLKKSLQRSYETLAP